MIGTWANAAALVVGTLIGCIFKKGLKKQYEQTMYVAMGLAAFGIGMENVVNNLPKSKFPVLFIISLALGGLLGSFLQVDRHFNRLIARLGQSELGKGLATEILLCCIGALSIVGPVMAAVKGDNTMLFTNASLDFVTAMVFGASFGWGMLLTAPVLVCWQGLIFLVAKYLSASFFTGPLLTEISIIGGFLIACTGLELLKIKKINTLDFLPSLLVPIVFFLVKMLF
jgi:uncharacterized membrane protein YqgA involved in biofilm formation